MPKIPWDYREWFSRRELNPHHKSRRNPQEWDGNWALNSHPDPKKAALSFPTFSPFFPIFFPAFPGGLDSLGLVVSSLEKGEEPSDVKRCSPKTVGTMEKNQKNPWIPQNPTQIPAIPPQNPTSKQNIPFKPQPLEVKLNFSPRFVENPAANPSIPSQNIEICWNSHLTGKLWSGFILSNKL